jgi:arginine-tRNA-protein transferase
MSRTGSGASPNDKRLGSYHQCYRLDGKLVAVAVLDLLPHGVSAVYMTYEPDLDQWEFGKLSALREIAMAIQDGYQYYYMGMKKKLGEISESLMANTGYYIHSCVKMRYKGAYQPQYILGKNTVSQI